jgi:S1-C subfamily serine protease
MTRLRPAARRRGLLAAALASSLAAAGCTAASGRGTNPDPFDADPFVRSFHALKPAVVLFTMKIPSDDKKRKGEFDDAYGSGVAIASGAWGTQILTVQHVVVDARDLRATLDDRRAVPARVLASDEKEDLALVQIATPNRPVATLAASSNVEPGTQIGVAGYPIPDAFEDEHLGTKTSVFAGRVSSIRPDALELDLPIIPGESGGPVFDANSGLVIGLAESRFDDEKAIGFGVPIEDAEHFLRGRVHGTLHVALAGEGRDMR